MQGQGQGQEAEAEARSWPLAPGTSLGPYRIVRFLGEGGMGAVYEGLHGAIGKKVAIKVMSPELAAIPEARARFLIEAQLTSRVRHPHTVEVTDVAVEGEQPFMVMEYLEGEDLARTIRRRGPLPLAEVVDIALPVLAAVATAHEEGIVHRDLKPQNVFLARMRDGTLHPKVLDFGISEAPALFEACSINAGMMLGSPTYFAPEQVNDSKAVSAASDQYSLGLLLYQCVTGRLPYEGATLPDIFRAIVAGGYPSAGSYRPDLPEGLERIIARAMSLEPGDRYPSVKEMGRALLAFAGQRTQIIWQSQFADVRPAAVSFHVPVTDQTPGPEWSPLAVTRGLRAEAPPPRRLPEIAVEAAPAIAESASIEAVLAIAEPPSNPSLSIPRRSFSWAMGGGIAVAAVALFAAIALRGRAAPRAVAPVAPAPAQAVAPPAAAPLRPALPAPVAASPPVAAAYAVEEPRKLKTVRAWPARRVHPARQARAPKGTKFGRNRAPLIE